MRQITAGFGWHLQQERIAKACIHYPKMRRGKQVDKNDKIRPKRNDEYLFISPYTGEPYQDIKKGIKNAAIRAGITKDVHNHLLRHSGATAAVQAGVNLRSLQAILGHSDIRMTEVYTHLAADFLIDEGAKMAALHAKSIITSGTSGS